MEPSFGIKIFQDTDMRLIYAQWASAIAILYAAYIAASYQYRKDAVERAIKQNYYYAIVSSIFVSFEAFNKSIEKHDDKVDADYLKTLKQIIKEIFYDTTILKENLIDISLVYNLSIMTLIKSFVFQIETSFNEISTWDFEKDDPNYTKTLSVYLILVKSQAQIILSMRSRIPGFYKAARKAAKKDKKATKKNEPTGTNSSNGVGEAK